VNITDYLFWAKISKMRITIFFFDDKIKEIYIIIPGQNFSHLSYIRGTLYSKDYDDKIIEDLEEQLNILGLQAKIKNKELTKEDAKFIIKKFFEARARVLYGGDKVEQNIAKHLKYLDKLQYDVAVLNE